MRGRNDHRGAERKARVQAVGPGGLSSLLEELAHAPPVALGSAWPAALHPGAVIERFELVREIGRGGFGFVWEARDVESGNRVAFKALQIGRHAGLKEERLLREADVAERLSHPNIVALHDYGRCQHGPYLVLELLHGETLAARLASGPLAVFEALRVGVEMARGVAHAHAQGVVHRDLKPGNVFLCEGGAVKILDFGLAHAFGTPSVGGGTPDYMAPEQRRGAPEDERTDVFALGVILYRMLANELPFPSEPGNAAAAERPAPMIEVEQAPALGDLVSRMLEADPVRRPRDGGEALAVLAPVQRQIEQVTRSGAIVPVRTRPRPPAPELAAAPAPARSVAARRLARAAALLAAVFLADSPFTLGRHASEDGRPLLPAVKMLAVLPFQNEGGTRDDEAFSSGLREIVTNELFQLEELASWRFVSAREVQSEKVASAKAARAAFGATLALEGTIRWRPEGVSVTANLVDTAALVLLISRTFDVPRGAAAGLQSLFVEKVAEMLQVRVPLRSQRKVPPGKEPAPGAYEFYSQGRGYLQRYDRRENLDNAIAVFDHALAIDPAYALAHAGKAEAYLRRYALTKDARFLEEARASGRRAVALGEGLATVQLTMGLVHMAAGEHGDAIGRFQRAVDLEPRSADAQRELANAYDIAGRQDDAEATYYRAIEIRPDYWAAYKDLAIFHFRHGRLAQALPLFQRVVDLTPDNYLGYANLGAVLFSLSRPEEAARAFEKSIALRPSDQAYANLGTLYFYQQRYRAAADAFRKAIELNPTESSWIGYLGDADRWSGRAAEAKDEYRRAVALLDEQLRVNPRDAEARSRLAMHLAALGERERSLEGIARARRLDPKDGQVLFRAAIVYEEAGLRTRALDAVRAALGTGYSREEIDQAPELEKLRRDPHYPAPIHPPAAPNPSTK